MDVFTEFEDEGWDGSPPNTGRSELWVASPKARKTQSRKRQLHSAATLLASACMNAFKTSNRSKTAAISAEALIGLGITIGALGVLGLLLGWAQQMRSVPAGAMLWFAIGAGGVVVGGMIAAMARAKKGR